VRHSHCAPYGAAQRGIKQRNRNGSDWSSKIGAPRRRVAALIMHVYKHNDSAQCGGAMAPCCADGAQTEAALPRRTARSVNATLEVHFNKMVVKDYTTPEILCYTTL